MSKQLYLTQKDGRHGSGVDTIAAITRAFVAQARGSYETDQHAIAAVARRAHVSASAIRRFVQPSRRPKSVSLELWQRIRGAYADFLRQQLARLEADIAAVEALDPADSALRDLVDRAEALAGRVREAIDGKP